MAKKKRVTRKKLLNEPDEFYTYSSRFFRFILEHKIQFAYGLAAVLVLVIVISGIRYFSNKSENKAFAMLDQSFTKYQTISQQRDSGKAFLEVEEEFRQILKKYPGKDGGKISRLVYANICYTAGEFEKAIALYNQSIKDFEDNPFITSLIFSGLGYSHEEQKEYRKATGFFDRIVSTPGAALKDEALFNLGRLYAKLGDTEKSKTAFEKIISDHPDSMYIEMIKEKVSS